MDFFSKVNGLDNKNSIDVNGVASFGKDTWVEFCDYAINKVSSNNLVFIGNKSNLIVCKIKIFGSNNKITFGENVKFLGNITITGSGINVVIGKNTIINGVFITAKDNDILIGEDCLFSNEIKIRSSDSHSIFDLQTGERINLSTSAVVISDHVWIGQDVFIGKNVTIARDSVIGAGSVVTKSIFESNTIIAGCPGRVIRKGIRWEK